MERTKYATPAPEEQVVDNDFVEPVEEQEIEYVKVGRGSLRLQRRVWVGSQKVTKSSIIKPNQHFWARPSEVPEGFADTVRPVQSLPPEPPLEPVAPGYEMKPREDNPDLWDVVDKQGKVMNERPLTRPDAVELMQALG